METKITYLFGAGASCLSLPVLQNMPQRMQDQINFINNKAGFLLNSSNPEEKNYETNER